MTVNDEEVRGQVACRLLLLTRLDLDHNFLRLSAFLDLRPQTTETIASPQHRDIGKRSAPLEILPLKAPGRVIAHYGVSRSSKSERQGGSLFLCIR